MSTTQRHPLIQQFFDSLNRDDDSFLHSLVALLRTARKSDAHTEEPTPLFSVHEMHVAEETPPYGTQALDASGYTVGQAVQQFLVSNTMSIDDAARQLSVAPEIFQQIVDDMMPLTTETVPGVAKLFAREFNLPELTLRQWLITGLRQLEMKDSEHRPTRIAARRKKP